MMNLEPKLAWLNVRLEVEDTGIGKLVKRLPSVVLGYSLEQKLDPKLVWLGERFVLDDTTRRLVIQRTASLLCCFMLH
jgi:hypothetical protein